MKISKAQKKDIADLHALNNYKGGTQLLHKTIWYLNDRDQFEYSWHAAFRAIDIPSAIIWGDEDAVAPAIIGESIQVRRFAR